MLISNAVKIMTMVLIVICIHYGFPKQDFTARRRRTSSRRCLEVVLKLRVAEYELVISTHHSVSIWKRASFTVVGAVSVLPSDKDL